MIKSIMTLYKCKFFQSKFLANGCSFVPDFIFKDDCDLHDEDYFYQVPKTIADIVFYDRMILRCKKIKNKDGREFYEAIAKAFYFGVKYFGWFAYYNCKLNSSMRQIHKLHFKRKK